MGFVNHWAPDRHPEWNEQQSAFHLGFVVDDVAITTRIEEVQAVLNHNFLDRVANDELFVSFASLGDAAIVDRQQAITFAREVAAVRTTQLELSLGVASAFGESVVAFVDNPDPIVDMQQRALGTVQRYNGVSLIVPTFPPHVAIAYANDERPSAEVATKLAEFPIDGLGGEEVNELCLLEVRREIRHYRYEVVERVPFGGASKHGQADGDTRKRGLFKRFRR